MLRIRISSLLAVLLALGVGFLLGRFSAGQGPGRLAPLDAALVDAVKADNADLTRLLLHRGANANTTDGTALPLAEWALANGKSNVAGLLLDAGARVDRRFAMEA